MAPGRGHRLHQVGEVMGCLWLGKFAVMRVARHPNGRSAMPAIVQFFDVPVGKLLAVGVGSCQIMAVKHAMQAT